MTRSLPLLVWLVLTACVTPAPDDAVPVDDTEADTETDETDDPESDETDTDTVETDDTDTVETDDAESDDTEPAPDGDGDGFTVEDDCNDADDAVFPGAAEVCNDVDDDCNGRVDDVASPPLWHLDRDGDGFGDPRATWAACTVPPFFVPASGDADCDDLDPSVSPVGVEVPGDGVDGDCDGVEDCWADLDLDGFGAGEPSSSSGLGCTGPFEAPNDVDCDDTQLFVYPRAPERCGDVDRDCDGVIGSLDADALDPDTWYRDADGDGFGNEGLTTTACFVPPEGYVADGSDCDDTLEGRRPGAVERCNGVDDDCDGFADDNDPDLVSPPRWYYDGDRDTFGDGARSLERCARIAPFDAENGLDCNDNLPSVRPGGVEQAGNALDEDCDGRLGCFVDADGDGAAGYTTTQAAIPSCNTAGYGASASDCNDDDPEIQQFTFWADSDRDGWGNANQALASCQPPAFFTTRPGDCDDTRPTTNPDAPELPGTERDEDCDGLERCFEDADGDQAGSTATVSSPDLSCGAPGEAKLANDCDDADPDIHPAAIEAIGDGVDSNCDGRELCFRDDDHDGYGARTFLAVNGLSCALPGVSAETGDCNDGEPDTSPGAPETCAPGDENCNGLDGDGDPSLADAPEWFRDEDGDGLGQALTSMLACSEPAGFVAEAGDCDDTLVEWGATCPWSEVAAGDDLTCGRRTNDEVVCVGAVVGSVPPAAQRLAVSGSGGCALIDGAIACWGSPTDPRLTPPAGAFVDLAAHANTACAVGAFGAITCWGSDADGVVSDRPVDDGWSQVAVGPRSACAVRGDGTVSCWGDGACEVAGSAELVVALPEGTCTLSERVLSCTACGSPIDLPTEPLLRFSDLDSDEGGVCALTVSGDATCAGENPLPDALGSELVQVDVGTSHACGISERGQVTCWGDPTAPLP